MIDFKLHRGRRFTRSSTLRWIQNWIYAINTFVCIANDRR